MAQFQILYWQDIPMQLKVWDEFEEMKIELPQKFIARIDQAAQKQGLTGTDDYLAQWRWGEEDSRQGTMQEVGEIVLKELEAKFVK